MDKKLKKYAELTVKLGVNVQQNQYVMIFSSIENRKFARLLAEECYKCGAKKVTVEWSDETISKLTYKNCSLETLCTVEDWKVEKFKWRRDNLPALIHIEDEDPDLLKDIEPEKIAKSSQAMMKLIKPIRDEMEDKYQWTIVAMPSKRWAKKVFPDLSGKEAKEKLLEQIFKICRITDDNNPIDEWSKHNAKLNERYQKLNDFNFEYLHYKNNLGTDLMVGLADGHKWAGGMEKTLNGVPYNPNMPTEEVFTMPHREKVNGTLVSTKPLVYNGVVIEGMKFEFKDGAVVKASATKNEETLKEILKMDENSNRLGEVALVPYDSPISNSNILFYTTLIDENASCHFALGNSYAMTLKGSENMTEEERVSKGANSSIIHEDFMVGSSDLNIVGIKHNGEKVQVFENGNFVF
ncbi:MAG: aminopeptidase [Christensenellales bacterium]